MRALLLLAPLLAGCPTPPIPETPTAPALKCGVFADGTRTFGVLHLNDVYRIEGLLDGRGGLARVRTLRAQLEATCPDLLLTHGGDALSPSLLSKSTNASDPDNVRKVRYHGAHMVDVLSMLDGDANAFDDRMFVAIGNHEFDESGADFGPKLGGLFRASGFTWLDTGLTWKDDAIAADHLVQTAIVEVAGLKVGLFGSTIGSKVPAYAAVPADPNPAAQDAVNTLKKQGADVIVGVTHLDVSQDVALLEAVPDIDVIFGGHNHTNMTRTSTDGRKVLKANADATSVRVAYITVHPDGSVTVDHDDASIGTMMGPTTPARDPAVQGAADGWLAALDADFCGLADLGCLAEPLTVAGTGLVAEELEIRMYETNLGDWVTDQALDVFAADEPDLAFVNSGGLRLNQNIAAGTTIPRQVVEELFPYSALLYLVEITGEDLQGVADRSIEAWEGNGHFLQISGWGFRHDPAAGTATELHLLPVGGGDPVPIEADKTYRVVVNDYLITEAWGRDGYTFPIRKLDAQANGTDLKQVTRDRMAALDKLSPVVDGRICNTERVMACRLP